MFQVKYQLLEPLQIKISLYMGLVVLSLSQDPFVKKDWTVEAKNTYGSSCVDKPHIV